jgi:hypothetical protein
MALKSAAVSSTLCSIICKSKLERLIRPSSSEVAFCCSSASSRSRVSRASFVSSRATDEMRGRLAFGVVPLLRAAAFGLCALGDLPPALDRRRIWRPSAQDKASWQGQSSTGGDGSSHLGWVGPMSQMGHKRTFSEVCAMSGYRSEADIGTAGTLVT